MTHADTVALLRAAHRQGMPPIHFSVFAGLLSYANWRWLCHPGQRALADLCSVNKDTVTASVKWLSEHSVIRINAKPRKVNMYEILARSHWQLSGSVGQNKNGKLSGSTAQFAVRSGRTAKIGVFRVNCPAASDVSKDNACGVNGTAVAVGGCVDEPSASEKVAFP